MVKGFSLFASHFQGFTDQYILIGGAACDVQLRAAQHSFRTTHDLDIVLCVEALTPEFVRTFWEFVREGGYEISQRADGTRQFYRFRKPKNGEYPGLIELFSRRPDVLQPVAGIHLTPIPAGEDLSSLSAILLDDDYARLIRQEVQLVGGVPVVSVVALIVLKACAWMDLKGRREKGERIDGQDIKKHRSDILNLLPFVTQSPHPLPERVLRDMRAFLPAFEQELAFLQANGAHINAALPQALRALF